MKQEMPSLAEPDRDAFLETASFFLRKPASSLRSFSYMYLQYLARLTC